MVPLSTNQIEGATMSAWPALKQTYDGLWIWRYARGFTRRANSIVCLDPVDGAFADLRLERLSLLSRRHRIAPTFRVTPLTAPEIIEVLDEQGWVKAGPSLVLAMETLPGELPIDYSTRLFDPADPEWYSAQAKLSGYDKRTGDVLGEMVSGIAAEARGILVYHKAGVPVAGALAVVASGIGSYMNVATHPNARRSGFGRTAMSAALNWVRSRGARYSAIQVADDNVAAINLYRSLGFKDAYGYHYRVAPPDSTK
jgi:ribosomal protein S18 acetylase RimI-like enzyme